MRTGQLPKKALRWPTLLCCVLYALTVAGCSHPEVTRTYEYHHRYDRMSDEFDPPVSLVYINPNANLAAFQEVIVGNFSVGKEWVEQREMAKHYASTYFRQVLARELLETGSFHYVSLDPEYQTQAPVAVIEGKITIFDTGSGLGRFLSHVLFFLQPAAAVDLQVEGRIRDLHSGETVLEFADRRRFLGHTPWGPTLKTLNEGWAMKQTAIKTAGSLTSLLTHLRHQPQQ